MQCLNLVGGRLTLLPRSECFGLVRGLGTSAAMQKSQAGRFKVSIKLDNPITYEEALAPHDIAHRKHWNSFNTESFPEFGLMRHMLATDDMFLRKFVSGTWHNLFVSEILIKRQANLIRIAGIVQRSIHPRKMYFLIGYTEEFLSYWMQCPVKLEIQTVNSKKDVIFKYV